MNSNPPDHLEGTTQAGLIWVRVIGRGNFKLSPTLKSFVVSAIQRGYRRLLVDLETCTALDSTFLGVLAGLAMHLKPLNGSIQLLRLSAQNRNAITTLGLQQLMTLPDAAAAPVAPALQRLEPTPDLATAAANILAAHENLIAAEPENRPRFNELVTQLKDEIHGAH